MLRGYLPFKGIKLNLVIKYSLDKEKIKRFFLSGPRFGRLLSTDAKPAPRVCYLERLSEADKGAFVYFAC